ncbi:hypothetical protein BGX27_003523 [Mortierella sp. AM989]|nr:hypothetical protein BGX27_003523 [Mortierella sp. AM989]
MLKKLGLQTKDNDTTNNASPLSNSKLLEIEKRKARHNKKIVRKTASYDSLESESFAHQPHMPNTIYNPNPFPLDPSQPDGVNRHNAFHTRRETREIETIDIEIEETKGFVTGKSRQSIDSNRDDYGGGNNELDNDNTRKNNTIQKLGAGLKGALAKSGLAKNKEKDKEKENVEVDAVLQYNLQQQEKQRKQQQQRLRQQNVEAAQAQVRGRDRERQRTQSGHLYSERLVGDDAKSPDRVRDQRDAFSDRRSRLHSLSPPPAPGQERRNSTTYWPEEHRGVVYSEQMTPFIGYQPPPPVSPSRRQHQQYQQQQYRQTRPLSHTSDSEYGDNSRQSRDGRYKSRERHESDRIRREALAGGAGARRQSGLNRVTGTDSVVRTSSEFADDESNSIDRQIPQQQPPDRLGRAREWVASHSKNNSVAAPAPIADREAVSSLPGAFPPRSNRRQSMEPEEYGLIAPPRGSYLGAAGGGYDSRERMAMMTQMHIQNQEQRDYRESMADDGRYWSRQLEGYEHDRYRQSRVDYEYSSQGGFHGYPAGGPDDIDDEVESTLAPGSAVGASTPKKGVENSMDGFKRLAGADTQVDIEEDQLAAAKPPNKKRLILRLISLASSLLVLVLLIAAAPISKSSSPFTSHVGLAFHYVVAILSILISLAFVFNYLSRRLRRREKMKRYLLFGLDILMTLAWLIDVCDMYNTSVFLGMIAFASYLAAFVWDIWGSFDHSKLFGGGPLIKPPPPGWDKNGPGHGRKKLASGGMGGRGAPGAWPGQVPGQEQGQGQGQGQGFPMKPKNSKALW